VNLERRAEFEAQLSALHQARDFSSLATQLIEGYGPELFGLLLSLHRQHSDASDVFGLTCEHLWRGLPAFERRASFRTWSYTVTRHASQRWRENDGSRRRRQVPLDEFPELSAVEERVRTRTLNYLQSAVKDRFTELRQSLPEEDQLLLVLRVDRGLDWTEVAEVISGGSLGADKRASEAARLRKRFQLLKDRLRADATAAGLVAGSD